MTYQVNTKTNKIMSESIVCKSNSFAKSKVFSKRLISSISVKNKNSLIGNHSPLNESNLPMANNSEIEKFNNSGYVKSFFPSNEKTLELFNQNKKVKVSSNFLNQSHICQPGRYSRINPKTHFNVSQVNIPESMPVIDEICPEGSFPKPNRFNSSIQKNLFNNKSILPKKSKFGIHHQLNNSFYNISNPKLGNQNLYLNKRDSFGDIQMGSGVYDETNFSYMDCKSNLERNHMNLPINFEILNPKYPPLKTSQKKISSIIELNNENIENQDLGYDLMNNSFQSSKQSIFPKFGKDFESPYTNLKNLNYPNQESLNDTFDKLNSKQYSILNPESIKTNKNSNQNSVLNSFFNQCTFK